MSANRIAIATTFIGALAASPALAQSYDHGYEYAESYRGDPAAHHEYPDDRGYYEDTRYPQRTDPRHRDVWLDECRRDVSDNGLGGAVIGGVLGGIAGNRIAGEGNRRIGTAAGAVVGAATGAAIDVAEDRGRYEDECLVAYDERFGGHGAGYGTYPGGPPQGGGYPTVTTHGGAYPGGTYPGGHHGGGHHSGGYYPGGGQIIYGHGGYAITYVPVVLRRTRYEYDVVRGPSTTRRTVRERTVEEYEIIEREGRHYTYEVVEGDKRIPLP